MENQHRKITGYRELTQEEIELMNAIKEQGRQLGELIGRVRITANTDQRAASIAQTDLQTGIMWLVRAVARPESF